VFFGNLSQNSMKPPFLPPNFVKCISPARRKELGVLTPEEALAKSEVKSERDLHKLIRGLLGIKGIEFIESRMDKRTTQKRGVADFIFSVDVEGFAVACCWECKYDGGDLTIEQAQMFLRMSKLPNHWRCRVIRSFDHAVFELEELGIT